MQTLSKTLIAVGILVGAAAFSLPTSGTAQAQGFYVDTPGFHVRVGHPRHRYYRRYYRPDYGYRRYYGYRAYGYDRGHPYGYRYNYGSPGCPYNYTVQGGVCKPYRGY